MNKRKVFVILLMISGWLSGGCAVLRHDVGERNLIVWEGVISLTRDTVIPRDTTLIIKSGTRVQFADYRNKETKHPGFSGVELIVKGKIIARGTAREPIIFTSAKSSLARQDTWGAINLYQGASAVFAYTEIEFAQSGIHSQGADLELSNSRFFFNSIGLRFSNSAPKISGTVFYNNNVAIQYHDASPQIVNCQISSNRVGIFARFGAGNSKIVYNNIFANEDYNLKLGEEQTHDLYAPQNYWGEAPAADKIFDYSDVSYLGRVLTEPPAGRVYLLDTGLF